MKPILLLSAIFLSLAAQSQITTLSENFDVHCVTGTGIPPAWFVTTPTTAVLPDGEWTCTATHGRGGTPAVQCSGVYSSTYHLDSSYLLTPQLNLSGYSGNVYLQFDSKTTNIHLGGTLILEHTFNQTNPDTPGTVDLTSTMLPVFSSSDSTDWVTHIVDLTSYKYSPFYFVFRYTSSTTAGSIWYVDNVKITTLPITLGTKTAEPEPVSLTPLAATSPGELSFLYDCREAGDYHVSLTDMVGRSVYSGHLAAQAGSSKYSIGGLGLQPGMYVLRIGNQSTFAFAKVFVQ